MKATIRSNDRLPRSEKTGAGPGYDYFRMVLANAGLCAAAGPGQFVMLHGDWGIDPEPDGGMQRLRTDPLLRRPFSIYRTDRENGEIQIVYRVMGKGTKRISEMVAGQQIDVLGPLGNPFAVPASSRRVILAAGSIGVPPLIALAERLTTKPLLILGGKTENDVIFLKDEIERLGIETVFVTEEEPETKDRAWCITGTTISVLEERVGLGDLVYACGPNKMLAQVSRLAGEIGFEAYVSFEERMACGIGVCLGCAVRHANGTYVHVCKDGPVFNAADIDWKSV
jgi:dihydroorotate dehydrogenase electron transfer subunit